MTRCGLLMVLNIIVLAASKPETHTSQRGPEVNTLADEQIHQHEPRRAAAPAPLEQGQKHQHSPQRGADTSPLERGQKHQHSPQRAAETSPLEQGQKHQHSPQRAADAHTEAQRRQPDPGVKNLHAARAVQLEADHRMAGTFHSLQLRPYGHLPVVSWMSPKRARITVLSRYDRRSIGVNGEVSEGMSAKITALWIKDQDGNIFYAVEFVETAMQDHFEFPIASNASAFTPYLMCELTGIWEGARTQTLPEPITHHKNPDDHFEYGEKDEL